MSIDISKLEDHWTIVFADIKEWVFRDKHYKKEWDIISIWDYPFTLNVQKWDTILECFFYDKKDAEVYMKSNIDRTISNIEANIAIKKSMADKKYKEIWEMKLVVETLKNLYKIK